MLYLRFQAFNLYVFIGIMLADTINQSEMQAARFHHNNIDVAMLKGNSSCGRPRTVNEDATPGLC